MNKKRIVQLCCAALVVSGIGLNIQNAIADYGIGQNSLSLVAGPGSNSGSNSNSNSNSNWNSNTDTLPDNSDSDSNDLKKKDIYTEVPHSQCFYACGGNVGDTKRLEISGQCTVYCTVQANGYASYTLEYNWIECQKEGKNECNATSCPSGTWYPGY